MAIPARARPPLDGFALVQGACGLEARSCSEGELWSLNDHQRHLECSDILNSLISDAIEPANIGDVGFLHAGMWECNLADESLAWSGGVYDIFGIDRSHEVTRVCALSCYSDGSRLRLEQLRRRALLHGLGFTIDVQIRAAAVREVRKVRVIGAPLFENGVPIRLHGVKHLI